MRRRISARVLWQHLRRGLLLYGASVGGSMHCYQESLRADDEPDTEACHWDWSIPHHWYDVAHRD